MCTAVLIGWELTPHKPPHLGSYTRALLVSQDGRHLFVTPFLDIFPVLGQGITIMYHFQAWFCLVSRPFFTLDIWNFIWLMQVLIFSIITNYIDQGILELYRQNHYWPVMLNKEGLWEQCTKTVVQCTKLSTIHQKIERWLYSHIPKYIIEKSQFHKQCIVWFKYDVYSTFNANK
jgi:hypothetical protein